MVTQPPGLRLAIQLLIGQQQVAQNLTSLNRPLDNPRHVTQLNSPIPNRLRVDHEHRTELALIKATGRVRSNQCLKASLFEFGFESAS